VFTSSKSSVFISSASCVLPTSSGGNVGRCWGCGVWCCSGSACCSGCGVGSSVCGFVSSCTIKSHKSNLSFRSKRSTSLQVIPTLASSVWASSYPCRPALSQSTTSNILLPCKALAVKHDLPILTTMHPNKGTEIMAGHLGAMLYRYSRACLFIRHDQKSGTRQITSEFIQGKLSHSSTPVNGYFSWDTDSSMMRTCEGSPIAPPAILYDLDKVKKVFGNTPEMASKDFKTQYGLLVGISDSTASRHINKLLADGIITSTGNSKATRYRLLADDENLPF